MDMLINLVFRTLASRVVKENISVVLNHQVYEKCHSIPKKSMLCLAYILLTV